MKPTRASSPDVSDDTPIAPAIVAQASHWLMRLWGGELSARQHADLENWLAVNPEHQRAWLRLQALQAKLAEVPPQTARAVLGQTQPGIGRRTALKRLGLVLAAGGAVYATQSRSPWRSAVFSWREVTADLRTSPGEIRHLQLADGSRLAINSSSAVDVRFGPTERRIYLMAGEILVESGRDPAGRPLLVETPAGEIRALGTRFTVREVHDGTRVELYEGALVIEARNGAAHELHAGQGMWLSTDAIGAARPANAEASTWVQGRLVAERQPLGDFLRELARHRPGIIRCDDAAAQLPITGVYPLTGPLTDSHIDPRAGDRRLANTDAILATLQETLPIRIDYRTRYWVTVTRRDE